MYDSPSTEQVLKQAESMDELAAELAARHTEVGRRRLHRLDTLYRMLSDAAAQPDQAAQEQHIRTTIAHYFQVPHVPAALCSPQLSCLEQLWN